MSRYLPDLGYPTAPFACNECDLGRYEPGLAHCPECDAVTDTYAVEPNPHGQVWGVNGSGDYLGAVRFTTAVFDGEPIDAATADELRALGMRRAA